MAIYYNPKEEALYTVGDIYYTPKQVKRKTTEHGFNASVNIEYRDNPVDPKTSRFSKSTICSVQEHYLAKRDSKEDAERYFRQAIIRSCLKDAKEISDAEAEIIRASWKSSAS